jgi:integrase
MVFLMVFHEEDDGIFMTTKKEANSKTKKKPEGLTAKELESKKPAEADYKVTDTEGLYCVVTTKGAYLWRWNYRFLGKQRTMSFGAFPKVTIAQARDKQRAAKKIWQQGLDPMAEKKKGKLQAKAALDNSFQSAAEAQLKNWGEGKDAKYVARIEEAMSRDVYPFIGHLPIAEIESPEIIQLVKAIEDRGAEDTARRMYGKIDDVFQWGIAHGLCKRNPAKDVKPSRFLKPMVVVNFARVSEEELGTLLRKIEIYEGAQRVRLGLKLLAHTFVRTHELIKARWSEIDFEKGEWRIPGERMKATKSRKKNFLPPHIVPLTKQTTALFRQLYHLTGGQSDPSRGSTEQGWVRELGRVQDTGYILPGEWDKSTHLSNNTFLQALYKMGYKGKMTGHGFRGVASTILHEYRSVHGFTHEHIELQLAHLKEDGTSAAYDYSESLAERKAMMQWWSDYLEGTEKKSNVLDFKVA